MVNTVSDVSFFILNEKFETVYMIDSYESLLWVDRFNECGDFEIKCPINDDTREFVKIGYYLWSSASDKRMIIEKIVTETSFEEGIKMTVTGRSLESILDRRVLLYKTVFRQNLEDGIRQLLDVTFIKPDDSSRKIENLEFRYSGDSDINTVEVNFEFDVGTTVLSAIQEMLKKHHLGYKMIVEDDSKFIFFLTKGVDRSYDQDANPWIIFSTKFYNLISDKCTTDGGENCKNYIYVAGEEYNNKAPEMYEYGTATGLDRREYYDNASDIAHEPTDSATGQKTKITGAAYTKLLRERAQKTYGEKSMKKSFESEVESQIGNVYGQDYFIGDIVQNEDALGEEWKTRVTEFIIQHDASGLKMYPTFKGMDEEVT